MGQAISTTKSETAEQAAQQEIAVLEKMLEGQLDKLETKSKRFLPSGKNPLQVLRFSTCKIDPDAEDETNRAYESFFGPVSENGAKEKLAQGFQANILHEVQDFLEDTNSGMKNASMVFMYYHCNTLIRIDLELWRWNFEGDGFTTVSEGVLGYVACLSVLDVGEQSTTEFAFRMAEYADESDKEIQYYLKEVKKHYAAARKKRLEKNSRGIIRDVE